ncbi:MAG: hypothetical protein H6Q89_2909, partial [Myxococcaceae bacterium]|nr:hypothetical protein [Myxococcaceae bacterium]
MNPKGRLFEAASYTAPGEALISPLVRAPVFLCFLLLSSCPNTEYARLYHTESKAPSIDAKAIENLDTLGPTLVAVDKGINFSVYSERAERIELLLFDDPESNFPTRQFQMQRYGDVWNLFVEGIGLGQHYGYIAWGPNWKYDPAWYPG